MMLPQTHQWQVTLRDYLATLQLQDFDCGLPGLSFDASYFENDDDIYRTWITFENLGRNIVGRGNRGNVGVRMESCHYLLENVEQEDGFYGRLYGTIEPSEMAWLYSWDYAGNPYHNNVQVANRALASCMWDMILTHDKFVDSGQSDISQAVSSAYATYAYTLSTCIDVLDPDVVDAYLEGLKSFFDVLESQGAGSDQADLSLPSIVGMWYTARHASGLDERCEAYARSFIDNTFREAGYIKHGNTIDPSYNGISIKYLTWAALLTGYDFLADAVDKICKLKAHLTLPDSGKVYGPSSFATSTALGSPGDQHWTFGRDIAASYLSDHADYLRYGSRNVASWFVPFGLNSPADMLAQIESWTGRANNPAPDLSYGTWTRASERPLLIWDYSWHLAVPSIEWDFYPGNLYSEVVQGADTKPPFEREGDFIENFDDEFVAWKIGGMGGIIHTGGLSWWPPKDGVALAGLSGGSLCALWTKKGGISVLGRNRGLAGKTPDTLANMPSWAVNHVWGVKDGTAFSSARQKSPGADVVIDKENSLVAIKGALEGIENGYYLRVLDLSGTGLQVSSSTECIYPPDELYETIPLWLGDGYDNAPNTEDDVYPAIHFKVGGRWQQAKGPQLAEAVKIERNGYLTLVELEQPRTVHIGPIWTSEYQIRKERIAPLHIDITETGFVRYTISGPYEHELKKA